MNDSRYKTTDGPIPVVPLDPPFNTVFMATNVFEGEVIRGFGLSEPDAVCVCLNHTEQVRISRREAAVSALDSSLVYPVGLTREEEG